MKIIYSLKHLSLVLVLLRLVMVLCYQFLLLAILSFALPLGFFVLILSCMFLKFFIISCLSNKCVRIISVVSFFMILVFVLRTNTTGEVLLHASSVGNVYPIYAMLGLIPANVALRSLGIFGVNILYTVLLLFLILLANLILFSETLSLIINVWFVICQSRIDFLLNWLSIMLFLLCN